MPIKDSMVKKNKHPVHYANFICHFGNSELLEYLQEIVVPAFTRERLRTFKDGKYFFHSVQVLDLGSSKNQSEFAICGRFVKDMVLRSEQRYDAVTNTLLTDIQKMETAPSAIFVLLLASHKLIYLLETANAPGLESFRSTTNSFLGAARLQYIDDVYGRAGIGTLSNEEAIRFPAVDEKGAITKLTKTKLYALLPPVKLEIVALSNDESLRAFVEKFETLQSVILRLVKPNSELDNDDFLAAVRSKGTAVGSETSSLIYRNTEGLIKSKVVGQLEAAAAEGNTEIKLAGKDHVGQTLRGSNDEFKVVSYLELNFSAVPIAARAMLSLFKSQRSLGLIKTLDHEMSDPAKLRLAALTMQVFNINDDGA